MLILFFNDIHSRPPCLDSNLEETLDGVYGISGAYSVYGVLDTTATLLNQLIS